MKIYTIGFSGKKADEFYEILDAVRVRKLIDIRLWRTARFVPWANGKNLAEHLGDRYVYMPELTPTKELLIAYKDEMIDWAGYKQIFNKILADRKIEQLFTSATDLDGLCFLCTEKMPDKCHRRLVAEYLMAHFPDTEIVHL
jgi:uncharacterized protein (DUF488 family)